VPPLADLVGLPETPATRHRVQYEVNRIALEMEHRGTLPPRAATLTQMASTGGVGASTIKTEGRLENHEYLEYSSMGGATTITSGIAYATSTTTFTIPSMVINAEPIIQALQAATGGFVLSANVSFTNTSTITVTMNQVWNDWNLAYGTTANCCTQTTYPNPEWGTRTNYAQILADKAAWGVWNDRYATIQEAGSEAQRIQRYSRRRLSEAELIAELNKEKEAKRQADERAQKLRVAGETAEKLLRTCLSPEQIEDLDKKRCFYVEVEGRSPGKKERYRIERDTHVVKQLDEKGSIIRSFCIYVPGVPQADTMLAQKLFLDSGEETREQFWETANITAMQVEKAIPLTVPRHERRRYAEAHGLLH
jgi:hypothetical protein